MHGVSVAASHTVRIWIAGDHQDALRVVRGFCHAEGACFSVQPVDYVYTGGRESGVVVSRINYARFPASPAFIDDQCRRLAVALAVALHQKSYSIEGPSLTEYFTVEVPALSQESK